MIRQVALGWGLLLLASSGHAASRESEFVSGMLERFRAANPGTEYRISLEDPLAIEMKYEGEWGNAVINLHRIYEYCFRNSAEDCEGVSSEFVTRVSAPLHVPTVADLRIIVRDRQYLNYILESMPSGNAPSYRQIGEDLFALLAFDSPETITVAGRDKLREFGLDDADAWKLARTQMQAVLPALPGGTDLAQRPVAFEEYDYLASLLADLEAWRGIAREAGPDMFVTAVSDHFVFVAAMPAGPRFDAFKKTVREDCEAQERCISPHIYRFRGGRWVIAD